MKEEDNHDLSTPSRRPADEKTSQIIELVVRVVTLGAEPGRRRINVGTISIPERFLSRRVVALLAFIGGNITGDSFDFSQLMGLLA